tara:strand:+ start:144 stop:2297 length:2154 start_codon:yes stop_codon:yes gene_type:complete
MSRDKTASLDILAEAHLPADLLTPTLGSNYGMDGYPDMEYGMGTLTGILDQDAQEAPALPTGLQKGAAGEMALGELMADESLADLNWLDPDQPQDPDRLPQNPVDLAIPELVEAWGVHRRTDGVHRTDLAHTNALADTPKKKANARTIEKVVTHAMRRSVEGQHIERIVHEAAESMGTDMERVVPLLRRVAADHGLAGNVFIRASAYPGWGSGKGKAHAKKYAKQAQYIIVSERDMEQATWIQNGRCAYTGKKAVTEIPWQEAYRHYMPRLTATGRKVAAGPVRDSLRKAFLTKRGQRVAHGESLPVYKAIGDDMSSKDARVAFAGADNTRKVVEISEEYLIKRLAAWRLAHMLDDTQVNDILGGGGTTTEKMAAATRLVTAASGSAFTGITNSGENAALVRHERLLADKRDRRQAHGERLADLAASRRRKEIQSRVATVLGHIERGARGSYLRKIIAKTIPTEYAKEASVLLLPTLKETGALKDTVPKTASYEGPVFEPAQRERASITLTAQDKALAKAASAGGTSVGIIKNTLHKIRQAMSEGMAGSDLTGFIEHRFTGRVLGASSDLISGIRSRYEGASGHLYVDAEAYASPTGSAGCEKAATKHRANQIPSVASMDRCATCTLVRTREDGTRKCGAYNKTLLEDTTGKGIDQIKAANIKSADMSDAEVTASYFAPTYDPSEFNLVNANLEGVSLDDLPETEKLSNIMFGGWVI